MQRTRIAFMPLNTYPEAVPDEAVRSAIGFSASLGHALHAVTYAVKIPHVYSPLGGLVLDVPKMAKAAEDKCLAECRRLESLARETAGSNVTLTLAHREIVLGAVYDTAATEARYFDLSLLPWTADGVAAQDLAQSVIFGSGRPSVVVPPSATTGPLQHLAVAWDGSRVAARALGDALPLLEAGSRVTVLTVQGEKQLAGPNLAEALATTLGSRGFNAEARNVVIGKKTISDALQDEALEAGAAMLVMGGYGHSRVRDFILGGATKGILASLRIPVLLSH